ncbi:hypothetical protein XI06_14125 [Bradyrhizobium sp. CCBAU 11434]|uniref:hypothetical protein n=1 Tax=Bradyrhizobium sp. CCBAU 11434 TaxID=1630885 RepID=UPI0023058E59|nr:hypothetical protein [Bradyrhizobium sp. CCBAU 11434]MDA9521460.1 hypothetical protein [Bradyrhizobium sp. CCBAU 11434]
MPGHRLPRTVRAKLRAGQSVRLYRGWRKPEPERPAASSVRQISIETGKVVGVVIRPEAAQLRLTTRAPFAYMRPVLPC